MAGEWQPGHWPGGQWYETQWWPDERSHDGGSQPTTTAAAASEPAAEPAAEPELTAVHAFIQLEAAEAADAELTLELVAVAMMLCKTGAVSEVGP